MFRHFVRKSLLLLLLSTGLSGCGILELKDRLLDAIVNQVPFSLEQSMGQQLRPSILPDAQIVRDAKLQAQLQKLLAPLINTNTNANFPITIYISSDPVLNAFAIPGGILIFNSGMLLAVSSPEEILGVAAHELAHATQRHVLRSMVQNLSIAAALTIFLGDASGLIGFILQQGQVLLQKGFSRQQEADADRIGFQYLVRSDIDPRGMSKFFERLQDLKQQKEQARGSQARVQNFFSTHPLTEERIQSIERMYAQLKPSERRELQAVRFDLKGFQRRLQGVVEATKPR